MSRSTRREWHVDSGRPFGVSMKGMWDVVSCRL